MYSSQFAQYTDSRRTQVSCPCVIDVLNRLGFDVFDPQAKLLEFCLEVGALVFESFTGCLLVYSTLQQAAVSTTSFMMHREYKPRYGPKIADQYSRISSSMRLAASDTADASSSVKYVPVIRLAGPAILIAP